MYVFVDVGMQFVLLEDLFDFLGDPQHILDYTLAGELEQTDPQLPVRKSTSRHQMLLLQSLHWLFCQLPFYCHPRNLSRHLS